MPQESLQPLTKRPAAGMLTSYYKFPLRSQLSRAHRELIATLRGLDVSSLASSPQAFIFPPRGSTPSPALKEFPLDWSLPLPRRQSSLSVHLPA